jgi:hypothetical protein
VSRIFGREQEEAEAAEKRHPQITPMNADEKYDFVTRAWPVPSLLSPLPPVQIIVSAAESSCAGDLVLLQV